MSAPLLSVGATVMCAHGGRVLLTPNAKLTLSGQPAAQWMPVLMIAGCANPTPPANTGPDLTVPLMPPSFTTKVLSNGQPLLLQTIAGVPVPSGIPLLPCPSAGQTKVVAT
jgi:hypothetical protein